MQAEDEKGGTPYGFTVADIAAGSHVGSVSGFRALEPTDTILRRGISLGIGKVADALSALEDGYRSEDHGQYRKGFGSGYRAALADVRGKILEMLREGK
jgi:hypothetical protein